MRYFEGNIYHPAPHALLYGDPGLAALPIFAPIFLESGNPALAINVVLLAGITLTAWSLHYVVESWTGSWLAGLVGAATFLTNPWEIPYFFGWAPTYAILCYLPFVASWRRIRSSASTTPSRSRCWSPCDTGGMV
jgi:hypothetical protein